MRKRFFLSLVFLVFCSCSIFKSRPLPYPSGVIFPLELDGKVLYRGRIIDVIRRREDHLYFSTDKGLVYSINGEKRAIRWLFRTRQESISPPYLGRESIYVFDDQATLYCIDLNGQLSWKTKLDEKITSGINENQGRVYLGTEKGGLYSLDQKEGKEIWRFQAEEAVRSTPGFTGDTVIFGCDDRRLYLLDQGGNLIGSYETGGQIQSPFLIDGRYAYFGSDDDCFTCFDLKRKRVRWKVKTGCRVSALPVTDTKRVVFLCWNGILYCLNKRNGNIIWWDTISSRSSYSLEKIETRVVITSLSSLLVSYDIQTGRKAGEFESGQMIQSNPIWFAPYLLLNHFDFQDGKGSLIFLRKVVKATLTPSVTSPQKTGSEIGLTVKLTGFFKPCYEFTRYRLLKVDFNSTLFFLSTSWEKEVVQEKSEEKSWEWIPDIPGVYVVAAEAVDEREKAAHMIPYVIEKEKPRVSIKASKESPQKPQEEVIFNAKARGLKTPKYEFSLKQLVGLDFRPATHSLSFLWKREVVQEASEMISWTWTPETLGVYMVDVKVFGEKEEVEEWIGYLVEREKPKVSITPSKRSPQEIRKKITFKAEVTGIENPHYTFSLRRLEKVTVHPSFFHLGLFWEKKEVQEESEKDSWEWKPRRPGVYVVTAKALGDDTAAESDLGFRIVMRPDRRTMQLMLFLMEFIKIFIPVIG